MDWIRKAIGFTGFLLPMVLALVCILFVSVYNQQAEMPIPMPQELVGEYSYDGVNWQMLEKSEELSSMKGDLFFRGHFLRDIEEGLYLKYYRDHIGAEIYVNGKLLHMDAVLELPTDDKGMLASVCAQEWVSILCPEITSDDLIEIRLCNPHKVGNNSAYQSFVSTLCADKTEWELLQKNVYPYGIPFRVIGGLLVIVSFLLLGAAAAAAFFGIPWKSVFLKLGLVALFAGGFIAYDTMDVSFWSELKVVNTYTRMLCEMLAMFYLDNLSCDILTGKRQKIAKYTMLFAAVFNSVLIFLSFTGKTVIFDTLVHWTAARIIVYPILILCTVFEAKNDRKKIFVPISGILLFLAFILDSAGVGANLVVRSPFSKIVFLLLFIVFMFHGANVIVNNYRDSVRAEKLEKELEDSRIAIMLSQIKPHFLYNVLNAIYHLYRKEPETAQEAVSNFAEYLRCNMLSIEKTEPIAFIEEYKHIQTYLSLEQMRFRGKLDVIYDVETTDFKLPPLTIEPLVENAVKHGVTKKRGGGTVIISTRENKNDYVVKVTDTGIGFDPNNYIEDGKPHVGIRNVRQRLKNMVNGTLDLNSSDSGTSAVVTIPKKEE